jgi:superfamily II DNA or RNA helicase
MFPPSFDLTLQKGSRRAAAQAPGSKPRFCGDPGLQPREWQGRLIRLLRARLLSPLPAGHDVLVHAGPGAGKTLGALLAFARLRREGRLGRFVVFCHRSSIARQWLDSAPRVGLDLREWDRRSEGEATVEADGLLLSYQAACRHSVLLEQTLPSWLAGQSWLAIADEVHHLGIDPEEPEASAWGHAFTTLTRSARLRLGLSGTPFRADNLAFCAARRVQVEEGGVVGERIVPDLCVEPLRLIRAGDVRPLEFRFQDGSVEHGRERQEGTREVSPLSAEARESWRARNLRRAIRLGDGSGIALRLLVQARRRLEKVRREHPGAGGLVIARDIAHARRLGLLLQEEGDRIHLVHSQDPTAASRLAAFREGEADWLVSVDMCAEGFDAPRLRVVVYLTTVVTRSRFLQAITRAVRMDGERSACEPIPRLPSYVYAPADPLLIGYARSWSLSEPYRLRSPAMAGEAAVGQGGSSDGPAPLVALADDAGAVIAMKGPELPPFLKRSA